MMSVSYHPQIDEDEGGIRVEEQLKLRILNKAVSRRAMICFGLLALVFGIVIGFYSRSRHCFLESAETALPHKEKISLQHYISADNIVSLLESLSSLERYGGSENSETEGGEFGLYWKGYGLDQVDVATYSVFTSTPDTEIPSYVAIIDKQDPEKVLRSWEAKSGKEKILPPFFAYSASGSVIGSLVFLNTGEKSDFDKFNVSGCIALVQLVGQVPGDVVSLAELYGAVGVIFFLAAAPLLPKDAAFRGSSINSATTLGDPLTPFYSAKPHLFHRFRNESKTLPSIPVYSMSYKDALELYNSLTQVEIGTNMSPGFVGPDSFRKVKVQVNMKEQRVMINNIIGWIYGRTETDRYVIVGAPRDSSGYGAAESSAGTAILIELSRVFASLLREGWRPMRTIIFCSWDAGEANLIGSTEWVEEHLAELRARAVTYINLADVVWGHRLWAEASPLLYSLLYNVTQLVDNPSSNEVKANRSTVYESWLYHDKLPLTRHKPFLNNKVLNENTNAKLELELYFSQPRPRARLPVRVADYVPFVVLAGVPSVDLHYTGSVWREDHGHTQYDIPSLLDKEYAVAIARITSELILSLSDCLVLPFSPPDYAELLYKWYNSLSSLLYKNNINVTSTLSVLESAIYNFSISADEFYILQTNYLALPQTNLFKIRQLNDLALMMEKSFLYDSGLPGRPYYKHLILSRGRSQETFPGVLEILESGMGWKKLEEHLSILSFQINAAARFIHVNRREAG